ncbi:DNA polymerase III subunit gamma/tau [Zobellella maritima]|uniref:DNA polymerase III subunit gamma/tau n=1 Tax=Zobellella maritima TaxID=2059725 RepID=UPI000E309697|nr:DNA polymerase III subunit gamma/tau [Zobellella maritima]
MSYQVLARKWRPQRFADVVGQEHILKTLVNALALGRLHHAYLFSGTRGVGKTSIARLLAKALNCDGGVTSEPCGQCGSCREIEQGRFVDLLEIDAASRTKVEDTRELLDNVQYQPAHGRFKVYLIDEVHMLSRHSFNALLKTLEEPPPHVKFLLATTDPQKLPITILSRCLQFHLKSLEPERIDAQLQHILTKEQVGFEPAATAALARVADGSLRDALSLTDQALAFGNGEVRLAQVESMLGNVSRQSLEALIQALLAGDGAALMAQVAHLASLGPDYDQLHKELIAFWHHLALAQLVPAHNLPYADELNRLAPLVPAEQIQLYYQIFLQGRKDLPFAPDGRSALEMTLLRALAFRPVAASEDISAEAGGAPGAKKPAAEPRPDQPAVVQPEQQAEQQPEQECPDDHVMAARLAAEQGEILAEADKQGWVMPARSTAAVGNEPEALDANNDAGVMPAPAAEPEIEPVPEPAAQAPAEVDSGQASQLQDEAADAVARIRRLIQTRNRLRSQEPAASERMAEPVTPSLPPRAASGKVATVPPAVASPSLAGSEPRPLNRQAQEELPPLGAYDDVPWAMDEDDPPAPQLPVTATEARAQQGRAIASANGVSMEPAPLKAASLLAEAEDAWTLLLSRLPLGGFLRQLAMHSTLEQQGARWQLTLRPEHGHLLTEKTRSELAALLSEHAGEAIELEVSLGQGTGQTPYEIEQQLFQAAKVRARDEIEADDAVQFLISRFAASLDLDSIEPMAE